MNSTCSRGVVRVSTLSSLPEPGSGVGLVERSECDDAVHLNVKGPSLVAHGSFMALFRRKKIRCDEKKFSWSQVVLSDEEIKRRWCHGVVATGTDLDSLGQNSVG